VLDLRLYRASLLPFAVAVIVAAFSLSTRPGPLTGPLPPDAFNAGRAFAALEHLAAAYPRRAPGSPADDALAAALARQLHADGYQVTTIRSRVQTVLGERHIETVIASRPGTGGAIAILAHRDAVQSPSVAALSGTAALLELANDLSAVNPERPLTFISTSGGSGGNAGAAIAAAALPRPLDAAIVIGDVAGTDPAHPFVVPWSGDGGAAPAVLVASLNHALSAQLGESPGAYSAAQQLARFALPFTVGEQGPLADAGLAAVLVQQSGELGPAADEPVSKARLGGFGRAILATIEALEGAPEISDTTTRELTFGDHLLGGWAARLLVGLLILSCAVCTLDVLARARRRRIPIARWVLWVLGWAAPFLAAGLFAKLLAFSALLKVVPPAPVSARELPLSGAGEAALLGVLVVFVLVALLRSMLGTSTRLDGSARADGAPVALLAIACALAAVLWAANPYSAALVALPLALWLLVMTRPPRRSVLAGALCALCSLVPLGLALGAEAHALALGPLAFAWTWLLVFAGGEVGGGALLACALAGGVAVSAALILVHPGAPEESGEQAITVRGPVSYAGPGSLGGTDSALHR
jgi:hypothetical protein